jgi:hypothetical protein
VPWEKHPETKNSSNRLLDLTTGNSVVAFHQGIMEAHKAYTDGLGDITPILEPYVSFLIEPIIRTVRWRWDWEERNPDAAIEVPVDPRNTMTNDEVGNLLFDTVIWYKNLDLMAENLVYISGLQWLLW